MLLQILVLTLGVAILAVGADLFVKGASSVAERFGISPLVIGLVIVGFGTSTPELAVNIGAAINGNTDIAIGNVVGSNIANIGVILGLAALVAPLAVQLRVVRVELPIMIGISFLLWGLASFGELVRWEGFVLIGAFAAFMLYLLRCSKSEPAVVQAEFAEENPRANRTLGRTIGMIVIGLAALMGGAHVCVGAAVTLAKMWGMSELVIGLTIVAIGTSLPELASSVMAAYRGHADIAIGNVLGSNIYNILCVLGLTSIITPLPTTAPTLMGLDIPVMIGFALVLVPMMLMGLKITRWNGALLLGAYAIYVGYLLQIAN
ncbi:MAG TPA: calcium/sodium antiporter [Xanthomonadales bacterium]|nr:calcium/sodium antiporter [Xanthomonadales bacterium]